MLSPRALLEAYETPIDVIHLPLHISTALTYPDTGHCRKRPLWQISLRVHERRREAVNCACDSFFLRWLTVWILVLSFLLEKKTSALLQASYRTAI
jgi:hypothetical protein